MRLINTLFVLMAAANIADAQIPALTPMAGPGVSAVGCLIQSDFMAGGKHNFELTVLEGPNAVHYWRANDVPSMPWRKGQVISGNAKGPGCMVQSDFMSAGHGNLEIVIPETSGALVHYWHDSGNPNSPWKRTGNITTGVTGGACFITSDYKTGDHRNFEVMVQKGDQLWHYWHTAGAAFDNWPGELVTTGVTAVGPGCLIQSDHQAGGHRNFEVVVQKRSALWHHWHWDGMAAGPWPGIEIVNGITAPGCLMMSDYTANSIRNLEVLVTKGDALWHHWTWDGRPGDQWPGGQAVTAVTGGGCFMQSDFSGGPHANYELVVPARVQDPGTVPINEAVHYFRVPDVGGGPWQRGQNVSFHGRSEKICQLTGETDWESGIPTTTGTESLHGLGAADLGYPVEAQGKLLLLFGDSWPSRTGHVGDEFNPPDDAVGVITTRTAPTRSMCTDLSVNSTGTRPPVYTPARVTSPTPIKQGYFNVPSGGVGDSSGLTAFFWTDHCMKPSDLDRNPPHPLTRPSPSSSCPEDDDRNSVGRGVLARSSDEGKTFASAVPMPIGFVYSTAIDATAIRGLPADQQLGTYIFGVPRYRASIPYLAYAPPGALHNPGGWSYFIGRQPNGAPTWTSYDVWSRGTGSSWKPPGSPEIFDTDRCVGEFSVTWNRPLGLWLMLYNCDSGIVARTANAPWGPWSVPTVILSGDKDGAPCRLVMTPQACGNQYKYWTGDHRPGGFYAPFVIDRYTTELPETIRSGRRTRIYWLVSTWDPYQVSVMRTDLEVSPR